MSRYKRIVGVGVCFALSDDSLGLVAMPNDSAGLVAMLDDSVGLVAVSFGAQIFADLSFVDC